MLVIRYEIWPGGDQEKRRILGTIAIANDGTGDHNTGNYKYTVTGKRGLTLKYGLGNIKGYKRQVHSPWKLAWEVLDKMFKEREEGP